MKGPQVFIRAYRGGDHLKIDPQAEQHLSLRQREMFRSGAIGGVCEVATCDGAPVGAMGWWDEALWAKAWAIVSPSVSAGTMKILIRRARYNLDRIASDVFCHAENERAARLIEHVGFVSQGNIDWPRLYKRAAA